MCNFLLYFIYYYTICDCECQRFFKARHIKWHGIALVIITHLHLELWFESCEQPCRFWVGEDLPLGRIQLTTLQNNTLPCRCQNNGSFHNFSTFCNHQIDCKSGWHELPLCPADFILYITIALMNFLLNMAHFHLS